jgi:hypothetical protein
MTTTSASLLARARDEGVTDEPDPAARYSAATSEQTWALIRRFVGTWHRVIEPGDGYSDDELDAAERQLGIRLPSALREAHGLLGRRADLTSVQDRLVAPDQLELDGQGGVLVFRPENQSVTRWGIPVSDLEGSAPPDPPVVWEASGAVTDTRPSESLYWWAGGSGGRGSTGCR